MIFITTIFLIFISCGQTQSTFISLEIFNNGPTENVRKNKLSAIKLFKTIDLILFMQCNK